MNPPPATRAGRLVGLLGLAQIVSWGSLYYGFSLFVLPMQAELGWSVTLLNGALTLGLLVAGACAYPVGGLIDRHGGRAVMGSGSVIAVLALLAWSQVTTPLAFYLTWAVVGVAMSATLYEPVFIVLTHQFGGGARRAITTLTLVAGFASTVFMPLIETLLGLMPWRAVLMVLALVVALVTWPVHWLLLPRGHPATSAESARPPPGTLGARLRDPVFWGLTLWFTAWSGTASGLMFQLVPYLKSVAVAQPVLLLTVALVGPSQVLGRLVLMLAGDRAATVAVGAFATTLAPLAVLVLILAPPELPWLALAAIAFGIANGVSTILRGTAPAEWLGHADIGRVMGAMGAPMLAVAALAPLATAAVWSASGSARAMQWLVFAIALAGAAGFWLAVAVRRARAARDA
ncbi:MAG: MFS transporter [Gammaproteobacteria bacterium]|nr:MFS transporter [Gammaproteobacteria bacterium]